MCQDNEANQSWIGVVEVRLLGLELLALNLLTIDFYQEIVTVRQMTTENQSNDYSKLIKQPCCILPTSEHHYSPLSVHYLCHPLVHTKLS